MSTLKKIKGREFPCKMFIAPVCYGNLFPRFYFRIKTMLNQSHKKRKDSLEGSLVRVLFAVKLVFPKMLVPRLPLKVWENQSNCIIYKISFLEPRLIFVLLF